jgi:NAD(P)-dependent dehydrogenase (short-subunit alcohol dehydrogenase family)
MKSYFALCGPTSVLLFVIDQLRVTVFRRFAEAIEWAGHGVRVNAVAPGLTATPLVRTWIDEQADPVAFEKEVAAAIPQGRMAQPIDIAHAILFLASDESQHITGITLAVDGGYTAA